MKRCHVHHVHLGEAPAVADARRVTIMHADQGVPVLVFEQLHKGLVHRGLCLLVVSVDQAYEP